VGGEVEGIDRIIGGKRGGTADIGGDEGGSTGEYEVEVVRHVDHRYGSGRRIDDPVVVCLLYTSRCV